METLALGNSDLKITRIGFGAWAAGGPWQFGWGSQEDSDSIAAIHRALELGSNWIDTAAVYGLGHSEEVVGRAVAAWRGSRPYIFTKAARVWDDQGRVTTSTKAESIRREVEASLRRLKADVIDLYQMHWPAGNLAETLDGWAEMARLKQQGKVRWIGVSNFSVDEMRAAQAIAPITSLQPPYSLIRRKIEAEVLPYCAANRIGTLVYSPMGSGLLTGAFTRDRVAKLPADDWRRNNVEFQEPKLTGNLVLVDRLHKVAERYRRSPGEVAIAWTLRNPAVTGAIVGARSPKQVEGTFGPADLHLTTEDLRLLDA
jgi:aryl-alcohol dehydrogenase-like predicted oxidoreductase